MYLRGNHALFSVHCKDCKSVSDTNECSNQTLCKTEQVSFFLSWFFCFMYNLYL